MFSFAFGCRAPLAVAVVVLVSACASDHGAGSPRAVYRVSWAATRASDHAALATASAVVAVGDAATVQIGSRHPTEGTPAFPGFTVRLHRTKTPGVVEVVSRANLREANRNKKGKLKVTKRNIGALLPMRAGETLSTNLPGDPVDLTVRLERANQ